MGGFSRVKIASLLDSFCVHIDKSMKKKKLSLIVDGGLVVEIREQVLFKWLFAVEMYMNR